MQPATMQVETNVKIKSKTNFMKTQFKKLINKFAPICLMLVTMLLLGFGCNTSKPTPDPLAGWQGDFNEQPNQVIVNDYQNYIRTLSPEERKSPNVSDWLKDGTGQHAIVITI